WDENTCARVKLAIVEVRRRCSTKWRGSVLFLNVRRDASNRVEQLWFLLARVVEDDLAVLNRNVYTIDTRGEVEKQLPTWTLLARHLGQGCGWRGDVLVFNSDLRSLRKSCPSKQDLND